MKKIYSLLLAVTAASTLLLPSSCSVKEETIDDSLTAREGYTIQKFTAKADATKTSLSDGHTVWSEGDEIRLFWDSGTTTATLQSGAGTSTATFVAEVPEGKTLTCAVYPSTIEAWFDVDKVNLPFPSDQDGSFASGNIAVSKIGEGNSLAFYNVSTLLAVRIKSNDISKIEVESVNGNPLVGMLPVTLGNGDPAFGDIENASSTVSLTPGEAGVYYISVLSGVAHEEGLLLKYYKQDVVSGTYLLDKSVTTQRSHTLQFGEFEPDGNYYVTVTGAGKKNGLDWQNAFSAEQMWDKLTLTGEESETEKAAKIASVNGAWFHLGAGEYANADPRIKFEEENQVSVHFVGGYPAAGGEKNLELYRADFSGEDAHRALIVRGKVDITFEGIGFVKGLSTENNVAALDLNGSYDNYQISASMSHCYVGNNTNSSFADETHANTNSGAGLFIHSLTSFTADHVTFENNTAYSCSAVIIRDCNPVFTDCTFTGNIAYNKAAAVYTTGTSNDTVSASFTNCTFENNESQAYNGAALQQNKGSNSFTDCTFTNNIAVDSAASGADVGYGGAINVSSGDLTITGCTFSGNQGIWGGAVMYGVSGKTLSISGSTFVGNTATADGGALELGKGTVEIAGCKFLGNEALHDDINKTSGNGYGGAIDCYGSTNLSIEDSSFSGNVAWRGGAVNINTSGSASVTGVYFSENGSEEFTRAGGAIYGKQNWTVTDCTFEGNRAKFGGAINHVKHTVNDTSTHGLVSLYGSVFQNNVALECGGAICEESGMIIDRSNGEGTLFVGNRVTAETAEDCGGGALWAETYNTSNKKNVKVIGAIFKGNEAYSGGACLVYGNSSGMYFSECTFGGENEEDANYARGSKGNGGGGSLYMDKKSYSTMTRCTITGDHARRYGGSVFANSNGGNFISEGSTFTGCYSSSGWGGAIATYKGKMDQVTIKGGAFINCHSNSGGAILCRLTGNKLAITDYNGVGTLFQGNYADDASNIYQGGAIKLEGAATVTDGTSSLRVTLWKARFIGNYAGQGGAIYASDAGKPDIYIDRCSFDGNYITKKWGPVLATDGVNRFQMNNTTIRNSYTTSADSANQTDLKPSWVAIDGLPADGVVTITNTTIIGNVQYSSDGNSFTPLPDGNALVAIWGSQPNYLINNIIVPNTASVASVRGTGSEALNLRYNQLGTVANVSQTDLGGNVTGLTASDFDGLAWTDNCWQWNGTIGGNAPEMTTASDVLDRLNALNAAFVDWIASPDDHFDYYGTNRGEGAWWPGAYQKAN